MTSPGRALMSPDSMRLIRDGEQRSCFATSSIRRGRASRSLRSSRPSRRERGVGGVKRDIADALRSVMDEVVTMVIGALIAGAVVGFGLGFFGFKVRTRWCRHH